MHPDGSLWGWGWNDAGQLGLGAVGADTPVKVPQEIGGGRRFRSVSAGFGYTVAIATDGSLWAWGSNWKGQIGDGTQQNRTTPVQIGDDTDWVKAIAGEFHTLAFKSDGSMWAWGWVSHGRLGDGNGGDGSTPSDDRSQLTPKRIGTFDFTSVSVGNAHTLALKADGTLWGWGKNDDGGQLGDGTRVSRTTPTQIGNDRWRAVVATGNDSIGIKADGTLWMWGQNQPVYIPDHFLPIQVGTDRDWAGMALGSRVLVKQDGSLWAMGNNAFGQLGDGTERAAETPVKMLVSKTLSEVLGTAANPVWIR